MDDLRIRLVLEGADQLQTGAKKAADGLGQLGQAGQRAGQQAQISGHQLAQVSMQLQDFFIQIQGGQAPLTAFLQQGSQLTTVFGSMGGALRAVGGFAATLINPFTLAAAAAAALGLVFLQGQQEAQAYGRALILSGNAAGVTAGQLQAMAAAQAQVIGTQGQAAEALAVLAATGKVSASALGSAAEAATRLARVGVPIEETAKKFAMLGKEPLKALLDLNAAENFLTVSVYKQVRALVDQGRAAEAAAIAQNEYANVGKQRASELAESLGLLQRAWAGLGNVAKKTWDYMLGVGRPQTTQSTFTAVTANLTALEERLARVQGAQEAPPPGYTRETMASRIKEKIDALREEQGALQETMRFEARYISSKAASTAEVNRLVKADEEAAKAVGKVAAEREREASVLERIVGLSGSYQKELTELDSMRRRGLLTEQQYIGAVEKLIQQQPVVREQLEALAAAHKHAADARNEELKAEQRRIDAFTKSADQTAAQVLKLQEEENAISLTAVSNLSLAEAIERVTIARLSEAEAKARAAEDYGAADALRIEIQQREKLAGLIGRKEARDTAKRGAEDAAKEWKRTTDEIERSLTDALLRGFESGKGFAQNLRDTLVNMFKTLVLRPLIQPIMGSVAGGIGGLLGLPGNALASAGGSAGGVGGSASSLASLLGFSGMGSAFSGGFGLTMSGAGGTGLALQGSSAMLGSGAYAQGFAQAAGALAPWAMGAAAGIYGGRAISGGYSAVGNSGNTAVNVGTIAGAFIGGPIGAAIGGAIGGLVNRAFGRKAKEVGDTGIEGMATAGGFAGQAYAQWQQKGGWFRSDKRGTDYSAVTGEQDTVLDQGITALYSATEEYAKVLGYPVDALKGYASSFKVAWGKTDEENQAAIQAAFVKLGDDLAARYVTQLAPLQKVGETLSATLQRLSTLQGFSNSLSLLGGVFSRVASSSFDAREQLIGLAGGMDALSQQALGFAQNYYNRDEIAGLKAKELQAAFSSTGIAADPNSREQFRALVEAQDPNTEAGRKQLAALLALQGSFATVADYLSETGQTLSQAAAQAPTDALMSPLLNSVSQQLQLAQQSMDAQYETRDATWQVVDAVKELAAVLISGAGTASGRVSGYRQPEVTLAF